MVSALAAAVSGLGAVPGVSGASRRVAPATFVLVHGAWHGGWCWTRLCPLLRAAGHHVFAPTLTGLGERAHQLAPDVDLAVHVQDVAAVLTYEDLRAVVLVGHSYGGMVITGVAARLPERLAHLVYLDAFLPEPGTAVADYAPLPPTKADGWRVPPPGTAGDLGVVDTREAAWATARLGDQPLRTFTQPVPAAPAPSPALRRTFIQCTRAPWFEHAAARARRYGMTYHPLLGAGHDAMLSQPAELARLLGALA